MEKQNQQQSSGKSPQESTLDYEAIMKRNQELEYQIYLQQISEEKTFRVTVIQEMQMIRQEFQNLIQAMIEVKETIIKVSSGETSSEPEADSEEVEEEEPYNEDEEEEQPKSRGRLPDLPKLPKKK